MLDVSITVVIKYSMINVLNLMIISATDNVRILLVRMREATIQVLSATDSVRILMVHMHEATIHNLFYMRGAQYSYMRQLL